MHGLFWFKNAPSVEDYESATQEHKDNVLNYFDSIVTAVNPDKSYKIRDDHPCRVLYQDTKNKVADLALLVNTLQRHTEHSTNYCMKYNKKKKKVCCRFKFPQECLVKSKIDRNESGILEFFPCRNDENLNKYNPIILQYWRANMDIAPVLSKEALLAYLVKYISKSEISSCGMDELLEILERPGIGEKKVRSVVQSLFMKVCGERDFSAQEVCHILLGLKLYSAGKRSFVCVNLSKSNEWKVLQEDEQVCKYGKSFVEKYQERPKSHESLTLWEAGTSYNPYKWTKVNKQKVVLLYPTIFNGDTEELSEEYCKQQVLLHLPWRSEKEALSKGDSWKDIYTSSGLKEKLAKVIDLSTTKECENDEDIDIDNSDVEDDVINEEFTYSSRMGPNNKNLPVIDLGTRDLDMNHDWNEAALKYAKYGSNLEMQSFIAKMKESCVNEDTIVPSVPDVKLNSDQSAILALVKLQLRNILVPAKKIAVPKRVIIQGKAGIVFIG